MECDKCLCIQKWRDRFWKELKECIEACEDRVIGDINARVGDSKVEGIVGKFGLSGMNEYGRKLIELCTGKKLSIGNTLFKKKDIHKFA